jgi:hypothetical protein
MRRVPHSWREAYELALIESDPNKLIGRIEYALNALERRYSQWGTHPGTPAELAAIQKSISALERLMKQKQLGRLGAALSIVKAPSRQLASRVPSLPSGLWF